MIMQEQNNTQGVIEAARAAAPTAVQPAPVAQQPAPMPAQQQPQQGFGGQQYQSGFAPQPQPVQQAPAPQQVATDTDRTREQFEKLTGTNQRLSDNNTTLAQQNERLRQELLNLQRARQQNNQQFAPTQQVPQQQGQQQSAMPKLSDYIEIDQVTGERVVNEARFNAAVADIYQKASRAEQVVQNYVQTAEQREIERQNREAYTTYPELNPQGQGYNARLSQQTRAIVYDSMINPQDYGGRPLGFKEAADFVTGGKQPSVTAIPTPQVNQENQVQKEQAAVSIPNVPQQVSQNVDTEREYQRQVMGTRMGDDRAIAVRLLNATHRLEDVEKEAIGR